MKVLLIYPPVSSLKAPYLSVPALSAFLKEQGVDVTCVDLSILAFDRLLSRDSLEEAGRLLEKRYRVLDSAGRLSAFEAKEYARIAALVPQWEFLADNIDLIKAGLRGETSRMIFGRFAFLDEMVMRALEMVFLPHHDTERLDAKFLEIPHYLCPDDRVMSSSDQLVAWVLGRKSRFDRVYEELLAPYLCGGFDVVGVSVAFPDQLIQSLRIANLFKNSPGKPLRVMGGAYVSRVMAGLSNPRLFDLVDGIILNDGERPLLELIRSLKEKRGFDAVPNMLWKDDAGVVRHNRLEPAIPQSKLPPPDFSHVPLNKYLTDRNGMELPFMLSHGCYWKKCAFCNNQLSLVTDFHMQDARASVLPKLRHLIDATGIRSFYFVDEAMPPATLRELSRAIVEQGVGVTWHGNVRAEDFFTPTICRLMAEAGCHEIQMGVESLDDDVLKAMNKGTTVERIARVTSNFRDARISVHAYLIHGWPTQTRRHTARGLRALKKLLTSKAIASIFWHEFAVNRNSPMFRHLSDYGVRSYRLDPQLDIFDEVTDLEIEKGLQRREIPMSLERIERLTKNVLARSGSGRRVDPGGMMRAEISRSPDPLNEVVVFPRHIVTGHGHYSISQIRQARGSGAPALTKKPLHRIFNLLTGVSQEFSDDVHDIVEECRASAAAGETLRSPVDRLAERWGLERDEAARAVLSVLPTLAELGICLSGRT